MFFGREVEIEGASHHARRSCDGGYVSSGQPLSRDLGQRGIEQPAPGFEATDLPDATGNRRLGYGEGADGRMDAPYAYSLTTVNDDCR